LPRPRPNPEGTNSRILGARCRNDDGTPQGQSHRRQDGRSRVVHVADNITGGRRRSPRLDVRRHRCVRARRGSAAAILSSVCSAVDTVGDHGNGGHGGGGPGHRCGSDHGRAAHTSSG
jgi:hypothetical protein